MNVYCVSIKIILHSAYNFIRTLKIHGYFSTNSGHQKYLINNIPSCILLVAGKVLTNAFSDFKGIM